VIALDSESAAFQAPPQLESFTSSIAFSKACYFPCPVLGLF
jgi:hypothetical protein